ncbi:hypothetical protein [Pseudobdellovibrio exovorus]|uniref:HYDIN/VesB/CFA65-like Ig-like domain-containing protein n=1 Tax=Pseudobdellovibrio exovorus JSS TaxID=1184267 RepID=M4VDI5_9BACT|nr:hypothetical protein [Pseudobdellovibrio exovorus]AGH96091.1 hypothetical protein A11Q_1875 [Pseudobdellovibrio exovorus JSS]
MKIVSAILAMVLGLSAQAAQLEITAEANSVVNTADYYRLDFGTTFVHSRLSQSYVLRNTGATPLTFRDARIWGSDFAAFHGCSRGLEPNETCRFTIEFRPFFEGFSSGRFELNFAEDFVVFDLFGRAHRRM